MPAALKRIPWSAAAIAIAVLAGVMLPGPVLGQGQGSGGDEIREYIERTGEIIVAAADVVLASDSQRARRILQEAQHLHETSIELANDGRIIQARTVSRRARDAAKLAAAHARESRGQENRARQRLERYSELRDQLLDRAAESGDQRVARIIRESEEQALRSREQFRQGNFAMAVNLIEPAEAMLARAARLLFEGSSAQRLERDIERTQDLIDRTSDRLAAQPDGGGTAAREFLENARTAMDQARESFSRGEPLRCLHSLRMARRLAGQAADAGGTGIDPESVAQQLERWDERYEAVAERVADSGSRQAAEALERARDHRERAGARYDAGEMEPALRQLRAAFDLLNEASDLAR